MSDIIITPSAAARPAIFYDPNHNPLNIPCEGPKIVVVRLPIVLNAEPVDLSYTINFDQLFRSGGISALQSVVIDTSQYNIIAQTYPAPSPSNSKFFSFIDMNSGQQILSYVGNGTGASNTITTQSVPLLGTIPPLYAGIIPGAPVAPPTVLTAFVVLTFCNFILPPFASNVPSGLGYFGASGLPVIASSAPGTPLLVDINTQPIQVFASEDNPVHTVTP